MKKSLPILLLGIAGVVFAAGVGWLFELRLESGDVYPPYSSLRADPLGTMALYESLENLPELTVQRDFSPDDRLPDDRSTTYLQVGGGFYDLADVSTDAFRELESFLERGGRLVVAFAPETGGADVQAKDDHPEAGPAKAKEDKTKPGKPAADKRKRTGQPDDDEIGEEATVPLWDKWGVAEAFTPLTADGDDYEVESALLQAALPLPKGLEWHSGQVFTGLDKAWHVIYARGKDPVIIERRFGAGSVVLATDAYLLSNEALSKDRQAGLLSWMIGPSHRVVFDESHLGIMETSGVAELIRQYRLEGLAAGLIVLALLFIWKNSFSLVPTPPEPKTELVVAGKDARAGFVNMLARHVPAQAVLGNLLAEWKKSRQRGLPAAKLEQVQAVLDEEAARPPRQRDSLLAYRKIVTILKTPVLTKPN